jgi:hypothetical protein
VHSIAAFYTDLKRTDLWQCISEARDVRTTSGRSTEITSSSDQFLDSENEKARLPGLFLTPAS